MKAYRRLPLAFFLIIASSLLLRIMRIGSRDLWYDEVYSILHASNPWKLGRPHLYYAILRAWTSIFGFSETALRLPSALCSFFAVLLTYSLVKRILDSRKAALCSAIFIGFSSFQLWYAQETRPYGALLVWGLLSARAFYEVFTAGNKRKRWIYLLLFASAGGIYTSYFYLPFLVAQSFYILTMFQKPRWRLPLFLISGFFLFLPSYGSRFFEAYYFLRKGFWIEKPGWEALPITLHNFLLGYNIFPVVYPAFLILLILCFFSVFRAFPGSQHKQGISFLAFFFLFPLIMVFAFSLFFMPIYIDRGLILITPFYYAFLAFGILSMRSTLCRRACLGSIFLLMALGLFAYSQDWTIKPYWSGGVYIKKETKPLVAYVRERFSPGDIIGFTNPSLLPVFAFYGRDPDASPFSFFEHEHEDRRALLPTNEKFYFYVRGQTIPLYYFYFEGSFDTSLKRSIVPGAAKIPLGLIPPIGAPRVWIVSSTWERDGMLDDNSLQVNKWMREHFVPEGCAVIEGSYIFKYGRQR